MKRLEFIVDKIRRRTNNNDINRYPVNDIVSYLNDAQERLQSVIYTNCSDNEVFGKEGSISIVADIESYELPNDIYSINAIYNVELNLGSGVYQPLRRMGSKERDTVFGYSVQNNKLLISPIQKVNISNGLRVTYAKKLPQLDVRRGKVTASSSGVSVTVTDFSGLLASANPDDYFCVVDKDGTIKESSLVLTSFNTGTGVISTSSTFTNVSVGDYVVLGKNSTTHSELPDNCERYLIEYAVVRTSVQGSSQDTAAESSVLSSIETDIIDVFRGVVTDPIYPPITNYEYFYED